MTFCIEISLYWRVLKFLRDRFCEADFYEFVKCKYPGPNFFHLSECRVSRSSADTTFAA